MMKPKLKKMDNRSMPMVLRRVNVTYDVVFDEKAKWKWDALGGEEELTAHGKIFTVEYISPSIARGGHDDIPTHGSDESLILATQPMATAAALSGIEFVTHQATFHLPRMVHFHNTACWGTSTRTHPRLSTSTMDCVSWWLKNQGVLQK